MRTTRSAALAWCSVMPSVYGSLASQAPHWDFAETPAGIAGGPPLLGEHTELVLAHLESKAGLIEALRHAPLAHAPQMAAQ